MPMRNGAIFNFRLGNSVLISWNHHSNVVLLPVQYSFILPPASIGFPLSYVDLHYFIPCFISQRSPVHCVCISYTILTNLWRDGSRFHFSVTWSELHIHLNHILVGWTRQLGVIYSLYWLCWFLCTNLSFQSHNSSCYGMFVPTGHLCIKDIVHLNETNFQISSEKAVL
jgi:hypothetical protein